MPEKDFHKYCLISSYDAAGSEIQWPVRTAGTRRLPKEVGLGPWIFLGNSFWE